MNIEFDFSDFLKGIDKSKEAVIKATEAGVTDATGSLLDTSRNLAPLSDGGGVLRMSGHREVTTNGDIVEGEVFYNATETSKSGERINYVLITHELHSGDGFSGIRFKDPTTPGTTPKYLERPLKQNADEYLDMIAKAIREGLSK